MKKHIRSIKILFLISIFGFISMSCGEQQKTEKATPQSSTETTAEEGISGEIKVNPAHGLPGHTCALPVGAPLNSTTQMQANTPAPSTTISPLRIDQTPTINPPHGEPGHTCSLPVGAKLK